MNNPTNVNTSATYSRRNLAIDMLRALTMFTMIFVNDFWKVHDIPRWLEHAGYGEDFMGLADVVFPCFLFAVGMSIPYAIERRYAKGFSAESTLGHIFLRTFALLVMGAFITNSEYRLSPEVPYPIGVYWFLMAIGFIGVWNRYHEAVSRRRKSLFCACKTAGVLVLLYLSLTFRNPDGGVFSASWGILGAIGWTYLVCALVYIFCRDRLRCLLSVCGAFILICLLDTPLREAFGGESILAFPDRNFYRGMLNILHIGNGALPAFTMGGIILSVVSARYADKSERWKLWSTAGTTAVLLLAGVAAHQFWIVSKIGATPPWVFWVLALSVLLYGLLNCLAARNLTGWFVLIRPAGTATLTTYLIPYVFYGFADVTGVILPDWFTHGVMALVNCTCFAFAVIGVTWAMEKLHVKLKI
ncbi:DUF5009 domain-containing protein [Bacteroides helcogenes]|uniref:Uncharacterized protein n=1 Tax=Bacteroides helcogenes (strain ATCC 35417 / DSM 20613 / JCM 6297 / CCUG 15421 / P 36-108) TaxID=693979 RepID=E6SVG1_BACT6|nr:DUF5009 domain-containing protein [Bacteroides helcogenes]ADV42471.1 hypothetical protein Bache_0445 [Bacteroides helcogenes P 36-108]MDY5237769.1 DUF5009 domain-containing protein [Bacteroides helcogenes]